MPPLPPHQQLAAARSSHDGSVSVPVMLHPHTEPLERLISDESPASVLLIAPPMLATLRESCLALQQARQQRRGGDFSELQQRLAAAVAATRCANEALSGAECVPPAGTAPQHTAAAHEVGAAGGAGAASGAPRPSYRGLFDAAGFAETLVGVLVLLHQEIDKQFLRVGTGDVWLRHDCVG